MTRDQIIDAAAAFIASAAFYLWIADRDDIIGNLSDGAAYLLMADAISPWTATAEWGLWPLQVFLFPPLYPAVLGLLGGGSDTLPIAYAITALLAALSVSVIYLWLRSIDINRSPAASLTACYAISAGSISSVMIIQSESLFIALVFMALTFAGPRVNRVNGTAIFAGISVLARTAGFALVAAALIWGLRRRVRGFVAWVCLVSPAIAWFFVGEILGRSASYTSALPELAHLIPRYLQILNANLQVMPDALASLFSLYPQPNLDWSSVCLVAFAAPVWVHRLRMNHLDAWFVGIYLSMILLWPYPEHQSRFVFVLLPPILAYAFMCLSGVLVRIASPRAMRAAPLVAIVPMLMCLYSSTHFIAALATAENQARAALVRSPRWHQITEPQQAMETLRLLRRAAEAQVEVDTLIPKTACVVTTVPHQLPFYAKRIARRVAAGDTSDAVFWSRFRGCTYAFMVASRHDHKASLPPMYPYERIKDRMSVISVKLWYEGKQKGPVLAMLAKVDPP